MGDFRVLAIDPGLTTGFALLDSDGRILDLGEVSLPELASAFDEFRTQRDLEVVIELTPTTTLSTTDRNITTVLAYLRQLFPGHREIYPAWWKQTPILHHHVPSLWQGQTRVSVHMRDAVRIGIYYLTVLRPKECKQPASPSQK